MEVLYLIHMREFISTQKPIYKIGRSNNLNKAISHYPIGSNLLFLSLCKNINSCEQKILKIFKERFIQEKFYGNKFYSGNLYEMLDVMNNYINIYNHQNSEEILAILELQD